MIFLKKELTFSQSINLESRNALYVRNKEIKANVITGIQAASTEGRLPESLSFLQLILLMMKNVKKKIAINKGYPNPPFRTIEPIGPPIINITTQDTASENFQCSS